jgi:hypothetical protein
MHGNNIRAFSLSTAAALLLTALPGVSDARTIPGSIGRAANPPDSLCVTLSNSAAVNTCAHDVRVDFPLVVDTFGTITARVRAEGLANTVACEVAWWSGFTFRQSATAANTGGVQQLSVSVAGSISSDSIFVGCTLKQNGRVHTLAY